MLRRTALATSLAVASMSLHATTYTLEPDYTQGVFRWDHLGFSTPAAQFAQGEGTLEFDPADPTRASVKVTIPLASLHTGVPALDDHFRSKDFFATARFPTATFTSARVAKGAATNHLEVTGDLSLHGVTRPVTLDVTIIKIGTNPRTNLPTVGFDATTTLRRSDFGLGKYVPQVSDEIQMHIICQAVEAQAYAEYLKAEAAKKNIVPIASCPATWNDSVHQRVIHRRWGWLHDNRASILPASRKKIRNLRCATFSHSL